MLLHAARLIFVFVVFIVIAVKLIFVNFRSFLVFLFQATFLTLLLILLLLLSTTLFLHRLIFELVKFSFVFLKVIVVFITKLFLAPPFSTFIP